MTDIQHSVVSFIDTREMNAVREALRAVRDAISLKHELGLPLLSSTREAILAMEAEISSLKLALLRDPHVGQMVLPGMEDLHDRANEGGNEPAEAS
jgi:hypothetical protein